MGYLYVPFPAHAREVVVKDAEVSQGNGCFYPRPNWTLPLNEA